MQERGERYRERIAGVSERVVGHIEAMCPDEILTRSAQFEKSTRLRVGHLGKAALPTAAPPAD
jgi:hypothetical protein